MAGDRRSDARQHGTRRGASVVVPNYTPTGDLFCTNLSVLFGKRFENHGCLESHGHFHIPSFPVETRTITPWLPFNSHRVRSDVPIPLNLSEIGRLMPLLGEASGIELRFVQILTAASGFYARALRAAEDDPETAFLHLITCGEILSEFFRYEEDKLFLCRKELLRDFAEIAAKLDDGEKVVKRIKSNISHVKRRFTLTITSLLSEPFFAKHESREAHYALEADNIKRRVKAAYDLRSRYVHTGISFGRWVGHVTQHVEEVQTGSPVIEDKEFKKIISQSPTLIGLERIMRFCLLRLMQANGVNIDPILE
jgi:Apea-like HEPN